MVRACRLRRRLSGVVYVCVVGNKNAGKSTLLREVGALAPPARTPHAHLARKTRTPLSHTLTLSLSLSRTRNTSRLCVCMVRNKNAGKSMLPAGGEHTGTDARTHTLKSRVTLWLQP